MKQSFFHSLRFKLLLVSLTLLGIPWSGYYLVSEMEAMLEEQQKSALISQATMIQQILLGSQFEYRTHRRSDLFVHQWTYPIEIDGYSEEWPFLEKHDMRVRDAQSDFSFSVAVGQQEDRFVALLDVETTPIETSNGRDYVVVAMGTDRFKFDVDRPGPVRPALWNVTLDDFTYDHFQFNVIGAVQLTDTGYRLEISWPTYRVQPNFGVRVHTTGNRRLRTTYPIESGRLIQPVPAFEEQAEKFAREKMRIRVFDYQGWRIADVNRMQDKPREEASDLPWFIREVLRFFLQERDLPNYLFDRSATKIAYELLDFSDEKGYDYMRRRSVVQDRVITSVAVPLMRNVNGAEVFSGTIFVEQSTDDILYMQDKALQKIVYITFGLFIITSLSLLVFASVLASNIRQLKTDLESSVSHDGRITGEMLPSASRDEIGDVSRGISSVLKRLTEYNQYLEAMASRLAHELRTPLTVVKTSIDNARLMATDEQQKYFDRAVSGANRLDDILKRLREASRLEHALKDVEHVGFSIEDLVQRQVDSLRSIWPDIQFEVLVEGHMDTVIGGPELVMQALEKLIGNAIDFHQPGSKIMVIIGHEKGYYRLSVVNQGPALPEQDIFASMVSERKASGDEPHLGLGLYIVKLVAEYHRGHTFARNLNESEVEIGFTLSD